MTAVVVDDEGIVVSCTYPIDFDCDEGGYYPSDYCGDLAVVDGNEPRCDYHQDMA